MRVDTQGKAGFLPSSPTSKVTRNQTLNRPQELSGNLITPQPSLFFLNTLSKWAENFLLILSSALILLGRRSLPAVVEWSLRPEERWKRLEDWLMLRTNKI